jgi:hypothetical protein
VFSYKLLQTLAGNYKNKYTRIGEKLMLQAQTMTLDEKFAILNNACTLLNAGDREGYSRLTRGVKAARCVIILLVEMGRLPNNKNLAVIRPQGPDRSPDRRFS